MDFQPKTEKEVALAGLIPPQTICPFEVVLAEDRHSQKGSPMIYLKLKVYYNDGFKLMDDYLVEAMAAKLRHFCETIGVMQQYESGQVMAEHCRAGNGKCKIVVEDKKDGYPPKNKVGDYVPTVPERVFSQAMAEVKKAAEAGNLNPPGVAADDVPF